MSKKVYLSEFASVSSIMFGIFICLLSFMIAGSIFAFAKKRHILAFSIQQVMSIAREGINNEK